MNPRISYHTEIKCLARENLLANEIRLLIPRSNLWRWKHEPKDKYQTYELNLKGTKDYELIRSFAQNKNAKRIYSSYVRLSKFFVELVHGIPKFHKRVREMKVLVVKIIDRVRGLFGLTNVLRVFNISVSTFRQWSMETMTSCFNSIVNRCNRIYPTQLSSPELNKMKEMIVDPANQYWPISSIAYEALRDGSVLANLNTWYSYVRRWGLKRPRPADRRKKRVEGIRALKPNQIWHADISRFVTLDGMVHYIYLVVDNFSRKILSWFISDKVSALIRRETIGEALKNLKDGDQHTVLITDSGPENSLKDYLESISTPITHQKALLDIQCSNSMIEAHFKVVKYNYLYKMSIADGRELKKQFAWLRNNFDNRPHISLKGLTPNEAYENITFDVDSMKDLKKKATLARKEYNFRNRCQHC